MGKSGGVGFAWKQGKGAEWISQGWLKGMAKSGSCPGPDMSGKGGSSVPRLPPGSGDHLSARAPDSLRES